MNEETARKIAEIFSGEAYQSGGGFWTVRVRKATGTMVMFGDGIIAEFESEGSFLDDDLPINEIEV